MFNARFVQSDLNNPYLTKTPRTARTGSLSGRSGRLGSERLAVCAISLSCDCALSFGISSIVRDLLPSCTMLMPFLRLACMFAPSAREQMLNVFF
jgi:hypothetical protein